MVKVKSFKGIVSNPLLASEVASRPYDVVTRDEALQLSNGKQHSYYHVIRPEIELPPQIDEYDPQVYELGRKNLLKFIQQGYIQYDTESRFYIYQTEYQGIRCIGFFLLASIKEYENNIVKRHELTRPDKEEDRTKLIDIQNANAEPILVTYKSVQSIDNLIEQIAQTEPFIDALTQDDNATHKLWKVPSQFTKQIEDEFSSKVDSLYIADGHHRMQASTNIALKRREQLQKQGIELTGEEPFEYILTYTVASNYIKICGYHRIIKSLQQQTVQDIFYKLSENFEFHKLELQDQKIPQKKGDYSIIIGGEWYNLRVKTEKLVQFLQENSKACQKIDVSVLQDLCITPIFGIVDMRTDKNVEFIGGVSNVISLIENKIYNEGKAVSIVCYPVDINELFEIADQQQIMMPKSTWIIPKPRSGLVVRSFLDS